MKRYNRLTNKQLLLACFILIIFTAITIFLFTFKRDEERFSELTFELFQEEMLSSTLNMHYTLAFPEQFGISDYEATLPCYSPKERALDCTSMEKLLNSLEQIHPGKLSDTDAYSYELLKRSLANSLSLRSFAYYEEPLSPGSGMQSQLPILLAEYTFRSERDVTDYLSLLNQTDEYFASLLTFEQEKAAAGLLMPASSLEKVKEQCDTIITQEALEEGTHFLQTTFANRLQELYDSGELTDKEATRYLMQNERLLKTVVQPAYETLADGLYILEDSSIPLRGLADKPQGRDYYKALLQAETGSYRSVPGIQKLLSKAFYTEYNSIRTLVSEQSELLRALPSEGTTANDDSSKSEDASRNVSFPETLDFPITRADDMLRDLQFRMRGDFPAFPDVSEMPSSQTVSTGLNSVLGDTSTPLPNPTDDNTSEKKLEGSAILLNGESNLPKRENKNLLQPTVTIKAVSPSLEEYCAPAFYLTAPLDDTDNNVIYINGKNSPSGLELYTTLAHEGYPGHLYQTVYCNRSFLQNEENNVREILWYGGYLEGWALYVEFYSYDYASNLMEEQNRPADALSVQMEKRSRSLQLCLYSLLDIMIHYDNASFEQVAKVLENFGISSPAAAKAIYTYIAEEPCNYLKYYLGYLEILELQKEARELWGEDYSDYAFHKFYLDCGPSDFTSLSERLHFSSIMDSK